ncbi:MAG: nuclear transport factor 2 family protein [Pseudomonadota bacterium]
MSEQEIRTLTEQWLGGWDVGDQTFDGAVFRTLFAPGEDAIAVFDNAAGGIVELSSVDAYIDTWVTFMAPMSHWAVTLEDLEIQVADDMALASFRIRGTDTRDADGAPVPFLQRGTHVWRRLPEHGWRLVHEHLTAYSEDAS